MTGTALSGKKYSAYPEYKNSGTDWIGNVPSHWSIIKGSYLGTLFGSESIAEELVKETGDIPFIKVSSLSRDKFELEGQQFYIDKSVVKLTNTKSNYIVFPKRGAAIFTNKVNIVRERSFIDPNLMGWQINNKAKPELIAYLLKLRGLGDIADVSTVPQINNKHIEPIKFPICSYEEQNKIVGFLDHETAKIDTLITKQEKLIELLKEKRQAVISHAVTRGLNPAAPMKDSGVEWLGLVPVHWDKVVFRHFIKTRKGVAFSTSDFCDSGVRVVKASDIKKLSLRKSDIFLPKSFVHKYPKAFLKQGDIVLSTVGSAAEVKNSAVGQIAMVPQELDSTLLNQNTVVFDSNDNIIHKSFIFFLLQTTAYRDHLDLHAHGTANQASLNIADMLDFRCVIPLIEEQKEITEYLYDFIERVVKLEAKATDAIGLMKERKTALISAAVTGKIDVRNWQSEIE